MKRRKLVCPREYFRKARLGKRLTRQRVGHIHLRLRGAGRVCSAPVCAPPQLETVWVRRTDPWARIMALAAGGSVVNWDEVESAPGLPDEAHLRIRELSNLGIALVPTGDGQVRLVGTSPDLAQMVNRFHHGQRRRRLDRRKLVELVLGLRSNGRRTSVTQQRLEYALNYVWDEFGCDLSDLIDHPFVLI